MQEGGALQADVDEGRLHARQHPADAPAVDIADQTAALGALDDDLLHHAVLDHRDAGLGRRDVDQYFFAQGARAGRRRSRPDARGRTAAPASRRHRPGPEACRGCDHRRSRRCPPTESARHPPCRAPHAPWRRRPAARNPAAPRRAAASRRCPPSSPSARCRSAPAAAAAGATWRPARGAQRLKRKARWSCWRHDRRRDYRMSFQRPSSVSTVVRMPLELTPRPVELFRDHHPHQGVRQGQGR
jgi:hypothetical protein